MRASVHLDDRFAFENIEKLAGMPVEMSDLFATRGNALFNHRKAGTVQ